MHDENLLRNAVTKKKKVRIAFLLKKSKRNFIFRVQYDPLHILFDRHRHVFVWTAANRTQRYSRIKFSFLVEDLRGP